MHLKRKGRIDHADRSKYHKNSGGGGCRGASCGAFKRNCPKYGQINEIRTSTATADTEKFLWDTEGKTFTWTYYNGVMMKAFLMLDPEAYGEGVNSFYDAAIDDSGRTVNTYRETELDSIPPMRPLFDLIDNGEGSVSPATPDQKAKYKKLIKYVYDVMCSYGEGYECGGVVPGTDGNYNHKIYDVANNLNINWANYQVALDGLYMAQPFFMEIANALENGNLTEADFSGNVPVADDLYKEVYMRMKWIGDNLYDETTHLYNHGWGRAVDNGEPGVNGHFWSRAVGWYAAALADVIGLYPEDDETCRGYRDELIEIEKKLFDGMIEWQDASTGLWYNVINRDGTLAGTKSWNELETSGSALMAYAMLQSYCQGFVGDVYGEAGLRAFNGVCRNYLFSNALTNIYISSSVSTTDEGYLTKAYRTNEAKGAGPLIMAASWADEAAARCNAA